MDFTYNYKYSIIWTWWWIVTDSNFWIYSYKYWEFFTNWKYWFLTPWNFLFSKSKIIDSTLLQYLSYVWEWNYQFLGCRDFNSSYLYCNVVVRDNVVSSDQIQWMWTAITTAWSWLLNIWIQLLPYWIAFIILLSIFLLIRKWSWLKNRWLEKTNKF